MNRSIYSQSTRRTNSVDRVPVTPSGCSQKQVVCKPCEIELKRQKGRRLDLGQTPRLRRRTSRRLVSERAGRAGDGRVRAWGGMISRRARAPCPRITACVCVPPCRCRPFSGYLARMQAPPPCSFRGRGVVQHAAEARLGALSALCAVLPTAMPPTPMPPCPCDAPVLLPSCALG